MRPLPTMKGQMGVLAALVVALLGAADKADAVELVQPASRSILQGGSFAPLQIALPTVPPGADEWEAFLSLDGGAHYDFRITPHLDLAIDRYTWLVPNVDATNVRVLIRTGDERHETVEEIPASFAIHRQARAPIAAHSWVAHERPEPARPGDGPVVFWTEGDRAGSSETPAAALPDGHSWTPVAWRAASGLSVEGPSQSSHASAPRAGSLAFRRSSQARCEQSNAPPLLAILLTCRRLNI